MRLACGVRAEDAPCTMGRLLCKVQGCEQQSEVLGCDVLVVRSRWGWYEEVAIHGGQQAVDNNS